MTPPLECIPILKVKISPPEYQSGTNFVNLETPNNLQGKDISMNIDGKHYQSIWVDETRPRNQGARLTAWELGKQGVPYTLITGNAGGHLMHKGMVEGYSDGELIPVRICPGDARAGNWGF